MRLTWRRVLWLIGSALPLDLAAECGAWLRHLEGAEVYILIVPERRRDSQAHGTSSDSAAFRARETDTANTANAEIARYSEAAKLGPATVLSVKEGRTAEVALAYAEELDIDLIVLVRPTRDDRLFFDFTSTCSRLVAHASCAVLIVDRARPG